MKHLLLLFFLLPLTCLAQNLVPNPSFEDTVTCPSAFGQMGNCAHWSVYSETPDYYHACASNELLQVPNNFVGFQEAAFGNSYMGIWTYSISEQYRESAGAKLVAPMQTGTTYYVALKAARAENEQGYGTLATNGIGMKLSTVAYTFENPVPIDNNPVIWSSSVILDSLNWTVIEGYFTADSAYEYVSIAIFFNDANTDTINTRPPAAFAVYYIDDICVSEDPSKCDIAMSVGQNMTVALPKLYPNPTTGLVSIRDGNGSYECQVWDTYGRSRYQDRINGSINLDFLPNGLYTVILTDRNTTFHQQLIINH
jgi:hypothetical protein